MIVGPVNDDGSGAVIATGTPDAGAAGRGLSSVSVPDADTSVTIAVHIVVPIKICTVEPTSRTCIAADSESASPVELVRGMIMVVAPLPTS